MFFNRKGKAVAAPDFPPGVRFADTHCHFDMLKNPEGALELARENGVGLMISLVDPVDYPELPDFFSLPKLVGVHPHNAKDYDDAVERQLVAQIENGQAIGIGEIGLDYHYDLSPRGQQQEVFQRQLALAARLNVPVQLHIREANADALHILAATPLPERGVELHCCTLAWDDLRPYLDFVCRVAFGGALTFNKSDAIRDAASRVPERYLITETDSPYMAPVPLRGSDCEPAQVIFTAHYLAELRGQSESAQFYQTLYNNAVTFIKGKV
ncbi:MAG: TatD family hydrolase [Coriobacteriales bacterium]|jgi:TatD DNase family protein|nr:TatD family hydrolase [Coriobacteriales bacterium]